MRPEDQHAVTQVVAQAGKALGAYMRQLSCGPSRFDAWVRGESSALSPQERHGLRLFIGKAGCVACHSGPFFTDQRFHNVGVKPVLVAGVFIDLGDRGAAIGLPVARVDPLNVEGVFSDGDDGRLRAAQDEGLEGAFRTPSLRCVAERPSFLHTGQLTSLEKVVEFFSRGGDAFGYPGVSELRRLSLSDEEQAALVAFLRALSGPGPEAHLLAPLPAP
jgi:cytochrome c peroxidase